MITVPQGLPAIKQLAEEGYDSITDMKSGESALKILVVNLMPVKTDTEADILRMLSASPVDLEVELAVPSGYVSKHTPQEHITRFYLTLDEARERKWDGMIVTGAPLDYVKYEDVRYWKQICDLMAWSRENVRSTMWVCWGAFAVLYHRYGIDKHPIPSKLSGVFSHSVLHPEHPLMYGMSGDIRVPHSRHVVAFTNEILREPNLTILAYSPEAGAYLMAEKNSREILMLGHPEYDAMTLHNEYVRDLNKGMEPHLPDHYYPDDDATRTPQSQWQSHARQLYRNWLTRLVSPRGGE